MAQVHFACLAAVIVHVTLVSAHHTMAESLGLKSEAIQLYW